MKIAIPNLETFKLSGVYMIKNLLNNKVYIGSTKMTFKRRYTEHVRKLKTGNHHNSYLNNSVLKHGIENFEFSVIEILENNNIPFIREKESFYINFFNSIKNGYNISDVTTQPPCNSDVKKKISDTLKERYKNNEDYRKHLSNVNKGKASWNKGLVCNNISDARKNMFDDIEVYDINMNFFRKFDNTLEIDRFSRTKENDLPIPDYIEFYNINAKKFNKKYLKNKIISYQNIFRAIRNNKPYKGLYFKKVKRNK
jgi:group I intron endonuclease